MKNILNNIKSGKLMKNRFVALSFMPLFVSINAYSAPVKHDHDHRSHTHELPDIIGINHRHGAGSSGVTKTYKAHKNKTSPISMEIVRKKYFDPHNFGRFDYTKTNQASEEELLIVIKIVENNQQLRFNKERRNNVIPLSYTEEDFRDYLNADIHTDMYWLLRTLNTHSKNIQLAAVTLHGRYIRNIKDPFSIVLSHKNVISYIKKHPELVVKDVKNPTEMMQIAAIKKDPSNIRYIKKPTERVQLQVLKKNPEYMKYISNPTKKVIQFMQ